MRKFYALLFLSGVLFFFAACSEQMDFRVGLVTRSITGRVIIKDELKDSQPFIVVRKYNRTLIQTSTGNVHHISAQIIHPYHGTYIVEMEAEVDQVELMFFGRNHRPVSHRFKRTLGVSQYIFDARLQSDSGWRNSYYMLIKPSLTEYIVEQRFKMNKSDQLFLGQWMDSTEDGLDKAPVDP